MFLSPYWKSCNRTPDDITGVADHFRVLAVVLLLFASHSSQLLTPDIYLQKTATRLRNLKINVGEC